MYNRRSVRRRPRKLRGRGRPNPAPGQALEVASDPVNPVPITSLIAMNLRRNNGRGSVCWSFVPQRPPRLRAGAFFRLPTTIWTRTTRHLFDMYF